MNARNDFDADAINAGLLAGLAAFDIAVDRFALAAALTKFLAELHRWNQAYNLTAVREPADMVPRHVLDSLTVLPFIEGERIADVGTGAGLPGIPLALCFPARQFTLLDSNGKKIRFVTHAAARLQLANVEPVQARAESYEPGEPFSTILCRAFTALPDFIANTGHMLGPGGRLVAMKGRYPGAELDAVPAGWQVMRCTRTEAPGLEGERHIVVMQRAVTGLSGPVSSG